MPVAFSLLVAGGVVLSFMLQRPSSTRISTDIIPRAAAEGDIDTLVYYAQRRYSAAVRHMGDPRFKAAEPLLRKLLADEDLKVVAAAALAGIDVQKNLPSLTDLLNDRDPNVRYAAIMHLGSLPAWRDEQAWRVVEALAGRLQDNGLVGGRCLAQWPVGLNAHGQLCELLAMPDPPQGKGDGHWCKETMARNASFWTAWIKEHRNQHVSSIVLAHAQHASVRARARAATQLSKFEDTKSIERLIDLLTDPEFEVRKQANAALRRLTQRSPTMRDAEGRTLRVWWSHDHQVWQQWWEKVRDRFQFR